MIMATLVSLLLLGSGAGATLDDIDQMQDSIKSEIADAVIRTAALDIAEQMETTTRAYVDIDTDHKDKLLDLVQRYATTTSELEQHLGAAYDKRIQYQQEMLALRFELKGKLSREQWNKLFKTKDQKK